MYTTRSSQPFTVNMQLKPYLRHPSPANGTPRKKHENFILSLSLSLYVYIIYKHTHTHTQIHLPRTLSLALSRSLARSLSLSLSVSISLSPTSCPLLLPKPPFKTSHVDIAKLIGALSSRLCAMYTSRRTCASSAFRTVICTAAPGDSSSSSTSSPTCTS